MTDDTLLDMHSQSKKQLPTAKFDQTIVDSGKFGGREFWWPLSSAKISRFFFFNLANFKFGNSVSKALEKQVTMHLKKMLGNPPKVVGKCPVVNITPNSGKRIWDQYWNCWIMMMWPASQHVKLLFAQAQETLTGLLPLMWYTAAHTHTECGCVGVYQWMRKMDGGNIQFW